MAGASGVGGSEPRHGARRQRRARAPRLEEEEPGLGGGLTRFQRAQRPPTTRRIPSNSPPGTCKSLECSWSITPDHPCRAGGAEPMRRPGLRPAAARPGYPAVARFLEGCRLV